MKAPRISYLLLITFFISVLLTGCWNYREIDEVAVVAGVAVDKGMQHKFDITVEIVEISGGKEAEFKSKIISMEGDSIFEAARHVISVSGKRLYWSHAKAVIVSRELAEEGVLQVVDWFSRDAETRSDIHIFVSRNGAAKDILSSIGVTEKIISFELENISKGQKNLSIAPDVEIWEFTSDMAETGVSPIAAVVDLKEIDGDKVPHVMGTAIFKGDRLEGIISGEESKDMLFARDEIKAGLLVVESRIMGDVVPVILEIFSSKTEIKPVVNEGELEINIKVKTVAAIDELGKNINVMDGEGLRMLEENAGKILEKRIKATVSKIQSEYASDVIGIGDTLRKNYPHIWEAVGNNWADTFKNLNVNVTADIKIKNSAILSKPLEVND